MNVKVKNINNNPVFSEDEIVVEISKEEYTELKYALSLINKYENIAWSCIKQEATEWQQIRHKLSSNNDENEIKITIKRGMIG